MPATTDDEAVIAFADPAREEAFRRWLQETAVTHDLLPASVRLASADASFRRYFRVDSVQGGASRIVMDAPPDKEDNARFVQVAALMRQAGVKAPEVLAWNEQDGFLLLDDLGRQTMLDVVRSRPSRGQQATL